MLAARRRPQQPRVTPATISLVVALGLHAAALSGLVFGASARPGLAPETPIEFSVDTPELAPEPPLPAPATAEDRPSPRPPPRVEDPRVASAVEPPRNASPAPLAPSPSNEPSPVESAPWAPTWTLPAMDLGLDGGLVWQAALAAGGGPSPPERGGGAGHGPPGLFAGLDERDRAIGLGSGGPVVSAAHEAARALNGARNGSATIEVTTDAAGHVVDVRLRDVTSDAAAWRECAEAIRTALEGRTLSVPSGAKGVVVAVHVEVAVSLPSGSAAGSGVTSVANTDGVGASFDVSDLGANARSQVHARVLYERRL